MAFGGKSGLGVVTCVMGVFLNGLGTELKVTKINVTIVYQNVEIPTYPAVTVDLVDGIEDEGFGFRG